MNLSKIFLALSLAVGSIGFANAQDAIKDKEVIGKITKFIDDNNGEIKGIYETGIKDLYEVVMVPNDIIYINKDLTRMFVDGSLIDLTKMVNLTQERKDAAVAFKYSELPKTNFLTFGKGTKEIAIFADPNCVYCKKFEANLEEAKDIKVRVYPIVLLSPTSATLNKNILCAKDPNKAWRDWMVRGIKPAEVESCKLTGAENNKFAEEKSIKSTPTIIFKNGDRKSGAMDLKMLNEEIKKRK